jgi:HPt (histidine-containing phosphotransfer) domain-containing protein
MVQRLVEIFLADLAERLGPIGRAIELGDLPSLAVLVHPLAGASAVIGARAFAALCTAVENHARSNDAAKAVTLAKDLIATANELPGRLQEAVATILRSN